MRFNQKIYLIIFTASLALGGCSAANSEARLVQTTKEQASIDCAQYGDVETGEPAGRKNALKFHHCLAGIADKTLIPKSAFPDIWLDSRAGGLRLAKAYHDGKIGYDEYKAGMAENAADSLRKMQARISQMNAQQMQASRDLQALGNQMILQDQMVNRAQTPSSTSCIKTHMGMNCTQY